MGTSSGCGERTIAGASLALALVLPAFGQTTTRVSVDSAGAQTNAASSIAVISADGRCVAFTSAATNLVAGDTNTVQDVFVHVRQTGLTERVNVDSGGLQALGQGEYPSISGNGRFVAFHSAASNLSAGDTNATIDIFVRDRQLGTTERASLSSAGESGNGLSEHPALSADARFVAFESWASNLVAGDTNVAPDVFVHDRQLGTTERVSIDSVGAQANSQSHTCSISADGRFVAFHSDATNLVAGDTNAKRDVFVRDRLLGTTERVSVDSAGAEGNADSSQPSISSNGRWVGFLSNANNLVAGDTNVWRDVFVHDRLLGTTERVSIDSGGAQAGSPSTTVQISADGRYVSFESLASNLALGDTNGAEDAFVHDRLTGTTELVSVDAAGLQGNTRSLRPSISADGNVITFYSDASNLVPLDTNGRTDIFVREPRPWFTAFCFGDGSDTTHTSPCPCGNTGAPGSGCAHSFDPNGASLGATGTLTFDDLALRSSSTPASSFTLFLQHDAPGDFVFHDGVLCAGGTLIRLRGRNAQGGAASFPDPLWDSSITLSQRGGVFPGQGVRRYYSAWYRNASPTFCPPATANVTNGLYVDW